MFRWIALVVVLLTSQFALAQSVAMPLPVAVVKDADGLVMAQIVDLGSTSGAEEMYPRILLEVEGGPAWFMVKPLEGLLTSGKTIYFSLDDCLGDAAIDLPAATGIESFTQKSFEVVGPDAIMGTHRVFRSTSAPAGAFSHFSKWEDGTCQNKRGTVTSAPAEEVVPNPLEGFHGPTVAEPDRILTIAGGDRLVPTPTPTPAP
jgi:hypothetical protein